MIYNFIVSYSGRNGFPPSIREIGDNVGLSSTAAVSYQLQNLELKGYIERIGSGARSLRITNANERERNG